MPNYNESIIKATNATTTIWYSWGNRDGRSDSWFGILSLLKTDVCHHEPQRWFNHSSSIVVLYIRVYSLLIFAVRCNYFVASLVDHCFPLCFWFAFPPEMNAHDDSRTTWLDLRCLGLDFLNKYPIWMSHSSPNNSLMLTLVHWNVFSNAINTIGYGHKHGRVWT